PRMRSGDREPPPGRRRSHPVAAGEQGGGEIGAEVLGDVDELGPAAEDVEQQPGRAATEDEESETGGEHREEMPADVELGHGHAEQNRSEEHTSELQSRFDLV